MCALGSIVQSCAESFIINVCKKSPIFLNVIRVKRNALEEYILSGNMDISVSTRHESK